MQGIALDTGFPGANPRDPARAGRGPDGSFTIFPEHEAETPPGYRFRLDLDLVNPSERAIRARLRVRWDDFRYMHLRRSLFFAPEGESFAPIAGRPGREETELLFEIPAAPGRTRVSFLPRYGRGETEALIRDCRGLPGFSLKEFPMEHGPLSVLSFSGEGRRPALLAMGRIHPYETAGSFCVDAMARALAHDPAYREKLLSRFDLLFAPVMSPAGVALGSCRRNGDAGIDLARQWDDKDPVCRAVRALAGERPIAGLLDVHNWMHPDRDGIKFVGPWTAARFKRALGEAPGPGRKLRGIFRRRFFAHHPRGVGGWLKSRGARCLMVEYPWAGRDEAAMRNLGARSLPAFAGLLRR